MGCFSCESEMLSFSVWGGFTVLKPLEGVLGILKTAFITTEVKGFPRMITGPVYSNS